MTTETIPTSSQSPETDVYGPEYKAVFDGLGEVLDRIETLFDSALDQVNQLQEIVAGMDQTTQVSCHGKGLGESGRADPRKG